MELLSKLIPPSSKPLPEEYVNPFKVKVAELPSTLFGNEVEDNSLLPSSASKLNKSPSLTVSIISTVTEQVSFILLFSTL